MLPLFQELEYKIVGRRRPPRREDRGLRPEPQLLRGSEARTQRVEAAARGVPESLPRYLDAHRRSALAPSLVMHVDHTLMKLIVDAIGQAD